jgi:hypothetical protein
MASSQRARRRSKNSAKARRSIPVSSQPARRSNTTRCPPTARLPDGRCMLGMKDAASLLNQTLEEEMNAEKLLTQIAKSKVDITAATKNAA